MSTHVWPIWILSLIPAAIWLEPKLPILTAQDLISVLLYLWSVAIYSLLLRDLTEGQKRAVQIEEQLGQEKRRTSRLLRDLREEQEKVTQLEEQKETEKRGRREGQGTGGPMGFCRDEI